MRTSRFRLSLLASLLLILAALFQASAFGSTPHGPGEPHVGTADQQIAGAARAEVAAQEAERLALRRQMEKALAAFDVSSLTLPEKPAHPRLDSTLNQIVARAAAGAPDALKAAAADAPLHQGSSIAVSVFISPEGEQVEAWLSANGAVVANVAPDVIEAYVPVDQLVPLSEQPGVLSVRTIIPAEPMVTSQGAGIHGAPNWHANGYTGAGVKVGIIDTGFQGYAGLIGTELPNPVAVRCYTAMGQYSSSLSACENGEVHGTAVAEAVIDVAPGAALYLGSPISKGDLQATAQWMASQGVQVINHSVGWTWDGPGNGMSPFATSPSKTVDAAIAAGINWINAAGNSALSTWHGPYRDDNGDDLVDFVPGIGANAFNVEAGATIVLQVRWDDSWGNASRDLDLVVINSAGNLVAYSVEPQTGQNGHVPFEVVQFALPYDDTVFFGIGRSGGGQPTWVEAQAFTQNPLYFATANYSIANPADSANPGLLAVGAAAWNTTSTIEDYSSQGPTTDGRIKPDIVGVARGDSVSYGPNAFSGTSQAAPHVAGLAALVKQRFPHFTPTQVAEYLKSNAQPRGNGQPNNTWGWGLAYLPQITTTQPTATATHVSSNPFDDVWRTTDAAVAGGSASYSWFWGPSVNFEGYEQYAQSPGGQRQVRYYDKSRMEINDPNGNRNTIWYVTNGLLTVELVSGKMKTGDNSDQQRAPSSQLVAGDPQGNPGTPSYAAFLPYVTIDGATNRSYNRSGEYVTQFLDGNGGLSSTSHNGVMFASYQDATGHNIPNVFWTWMNDPANGFRPQEGVDWLFVLGYPISEPFWIDSTVGGQVKRVLVQLYERRVLTYTASNPQQYRVEFGNIGQHYYWWRYSSPSTPTPSPTPTHTPSPTPTEQGSDYPREGAVLYQPDMSAFQSWVSPDGNSRSYWDPASSSYVLETKYPVTADSPRGLYYWWESWDGPHDYSVTVDIVTLMTDSSGYNEAGLQYRVESSGSSIRELGETVTATDGTVASWYVGQSDAYLHANYTSVPSYNHGYGAVNQLKVIVKGRHTWVFLNGVFVNDFQLDSRLSTSANGFGMVVWRFGPNSQSVTKFGFRNLVVRAVN